MGCSNGVKAPVSMVFVQIFTIAMLLLSKTVLSRGTFTFALLFYRNVIATILIAPFAFLFERDMKSKLSWKAAFWIFINAAFGIPMAMGWYYYGLRDTSAAYSSNFLNLIPVVTFMFSILFRIEKLGLDSREGKVKILGSLLCLGGAIIMALYKGKMLHIRVSHMDRNIISSTSKVVTNQIQGTVFLVASCISYALWFIAQVNLFKVFPSKYWATMLTCLVGCFQTAIVGISINRKHEAWSLNWDLQLMTIVYSGVLNTGVTYCLIAWVVAKKGPTYPPMFNSLAIITTTILEVVFMGQAITCGSLLGMCLIIGGVYAFLWGKRKECPYDKVRDNASVSEAKQAQSVRLSPLPNKGEQSLNRVIGSNCETETELAKTQGYTYINVK